MRLLTLGINHKTAPIELREKVSFSTESAARALNAALEQTSLVEITILSTCNRTELYCVPGPNTTEADVLTWLATYHKLSLSDISSCSYALHDKDAVRHTLRVASGLDSMVLGEPQILGQMKSSFRLAKSHGTLGSDLNRLFQYVFSVAKQVRTETDIGENPVSVAYAATSLAKHIFSDLHQATALLVGAGEMIELVARHLVESGVKHILVANRTLERARGLADTFGGQALTLEELPYHLHEADIVISSTASPLPILGKGAVESALKQRRHKPIFMVDIAVPRDIEAEVGDLADVYLYTVDDLQGVIRENLKSRENAANQAEKIIDESLFDFMRESRELGAISTLKAYRKKMADLTASELERARIQLDSGAAAELVLERFAHNLSNKMMHEPSIALKKAGADGRHDLLQWAHTLFSLSQDKNDGSDT